MSTPFAGMDRFYGTDSAPVPAAGPGTAPGCGLSGGRVEGRTRSLIAWKNTYSGGMAKIPMKDAKIIPPNTGVPTLRRASCDAPVAITSGSSPRMKAKDVMTSFAFILGLLPLVIATGASQLARRNVGTPVFGGMIFASFIGIFAIPPLYVFFQAIRERVRPSTRPPERPQPGAVPGPAAGTGAESVP